MSTQNIEQSENTVNDKLNEVLNDVFENKDVEKLKKILQDNQSEDDVPQETKDISFLNPVFLDLFRNEPFLGAISMNVTKIADKKQKTAYIGARPNGTSTELIMGFNPDFMKNLTKEQQFGVIKHEIYHMVFQHIFSRSIGNKEYATLYNWATDLAINSIIGKENLPDLCLIPGYAPIDPKTGNKVEGPYAKYILNAPQKQASDHYFEELKKIYQENEGSGEGNVNITIGNGIDTMDNHDVWDQLPDDVQDQIRNKVREIMGKAALEAQKSNSWGTVPHEIQQVIQRLLSKEVDWRSVLRNFIGRTRTIERNSTIRKINKKLPYIQPGVKRPLIANFAVFLDQSGSVGDEDLQLFFGEMESLAKFTAIDVYHFDTEIDVKSHTVWKKGSVHPKAHRTRCGGTDFNAVADFCNDKANKGKWSGVIILTDGYAPKMKNIVGSRVLWVITETGTMETVRKGDLACQMKKEKQFKKY